MVKNKEFCFCSFLRQKKPKIGLLNLSVTDSLISFRLRLIDSLKFKYLSFSQTEHNIYNILTKSRFKFFYSILGIQ